MTMNINGGLAGGNLCLTKAGLTGLSGAATTITTAASNGATAIQYTVGGKFAPAKAFVAGGAVPVNDAGSSLATPAVAASGAAFRPLVTQQSIATSGLTTVQAGTVCCFIFGYDILGNLRVAQGRVMPYNDTTPLSTVVPLPVLPDWFTPISSVVIKLVNAAALSWTFGTSLWNATGVIIDPVVDLMAIPAVDPISA